MPYKDPIKRLEYEKERYSSRLEYWREYRRKHKSKHKQECRYKGKNSLAYQGEAEALLILEGSEKIRRPSDLRWRDKLIDVKTAIKERAKESNIYRWKFCLTQFRKIDFYLIICKETDKSTKYIFLIPDKDIEHKYFTISDKTISRYSKYLLTF